MRTPILSAVLALCLGLLVGPQPAAAQFITPQKPAEVAAERRACVDLAARSPAEAVARAEAWEKRGGGDHARLCRAMADFNRGAFVAAAAEFERLAGTLGVEDGKVRAGLLARAGMARFRAGEVSQAERLYGAALSVDPDDPELWIDRALIRTGAERYWDAVADLGEVLRRAPDRVDALLYRARAYVALALYDLALADAQAALRLAPNDPEALLIRGNARLRRGDAAGAEADWQEVVRRAPRTASAEAAADNLKRLQAGAAQPPPRP